MSNTGFMSHVRDPDARARRGEQHFIQVIADQREDLRDPQLCH